MIEVQNLNDVIDYKEDSISSKTLVEKEGGSLTIYAFDKTQGLGKHTSPSITTIQLIEGKVEITIDGTTELLREYDFVTIPPETPFSLHSIQKVKAAVFRVSPLSKK